MAELESFDPADVAAAEALDAEIDAVLAGRARPGATPTVTWLATAMRADPGPALSVRVHAEHERRLQRRWRPFRYAAAAMAYLFISQGIGNIVIGRWVADGVGEAYSPHLTREGGLALIAVGLAVAAGAINRRLAPVSVAAGTPLGLALGSLGIGEIGQFAAGATLHITQGVVAVLLALHVLARPA